MKSIVFATYGSPDVLQLPDIDEPVVDDGASSCGSAPHPSTPTTGTC
jgi:hypothetical protein